MKARKMIIRIIALLMALLMGLGIFGFIFQIMTSAADATTIAEIAKTGSQGNPSWFIYAALAAVLIIIVCVVVPKMTKKK